MTCEGTSVAASPLSDRRNEDFSCLNAVFMNPATSLDLAVISKVAWRWVASASAMKSKPHVGGDLPLADDMVGTT